MTTVTLRLDPTRCKGHGICALMASHVIALDDWGYGAIGQFSLVARDDIRAAQRAARSCPTGAITLERGATDGGGS